MSGGSPGADAPGENRVDEQDGAPRWVKALGLVVLVLVLVLVVSKLAGVDHGPGMHSSGDRPATTATQTAPAGHVPPADHAP